jgi:hypothetical protein
MSFIDPEIDFKLRIGLSKVILETDISTLENGQIKNLNNRENWVGDYGIDNQRKRYLWTGEKWIKAE